MNIMYATCVLTLLSLSANAQTKNFIDQPYLEVNGSADTLITPDEIFITIMISEKDSRDRVSVEEQEAKMVAALAALGIDVEKNLSASYMGSNFRFYLLKGKDVIKTKQYLLKVGDAETASKVFLQLEQLSISNSSIQRVNHSSIDKLRNSMRSRAVENAKDRASALLQPLHQNLGPAIHIADTENYNPTNQIYGNSLQEVVVTGYALKGTVEGLNSKLDFEKIKVAASVNVKFVIK